MTEPTKSTWDLLQEAIKNGRTDEALELLEDGVNTSISQQNSLVSFVGMVATHLAKFGEEELGKIYRERYYTKAKTWIETTPGVEESVQKLVKLMESPGSKITVTEEPDRYVVSLDPCRTGGRLRRDLIVAPSKTPIVNVGTMKKAYPWCWGKSGVSYYCAHSCLFFEILPIELRDYPIAVIEYPENPEDPCVFLFYKKPELIPEEYFTRVGKTKTIK
ncbi:hypothetical protein ACFLUO_07070 [Chloroflexota bacterium]